MTGQGPSGSAIVGATVETAYRQHLPAIVRYLRRRLGDDVAEDAAADVFARAIRAERAAQAVSLPWLFGVAANVISEHRRSERRRLRAIERLAAQTPSEHSPVEVVAALDPALIRALRRLDRGDLEALLLVVWGELTYEQTAEALDVPVGTVRSRIFRARKQLGPSAARVHPATHSSPQTARP
jgi:RNA polymerase sigma factor (sigma-70 family)